MALQLTIIKFPPGVSLGEDRKTIGPLGSVIGRGTDNDWVLSDPERFLSSKHCQITSEGERYYLTDLSTNGTFINGSTEPLGRGQRAGLKDGDSFDVGDYRFKVSLTTTGGTFPDDPFKGSVSQLANKSSGFGRAPVDPESIYMSNHYGGEVDDITPEDMRVSDPLRAIDLAQGRNSSGEVDEGGYFPIDREGDRGRHEIEPRGSQEDSADYLRDAVGWPDAKEDAGVLPEDWGDDISILRDKKPSIPTDKSNVAAEGDGGKTAGSGKGYHLADDDSLIVNRATPGQAQGLRPGGRTGSGRAERTAQAVLADKKPREPVKGGTPVGGAMDRTLVDSLGLKNVELSDSQIRDIHANVGVMMRETLDGLMQILRSRASIKNEFRINITTIQPVENNPIKFSANVDEIIELMFLRRTKAYKGPVEAVQESFNTIADHQLAVIAGIRSAFRSALGKFDPLILEEEFRQAGKGGVLPGFLKGGLWNAYQEHYQKMVNDMERSFQDLFGDEFVQAYEDQLRKLAHARKRDV